MENYCKPKITSYSAERLHEVIGPVQTASVELQIYYQQIPQSQAKLDKIEKVIMLAETQKPHIYRLNNTA